MLWAPRPRLTQDTKIHEYVKKHFFFAYKQNTKKWLYGTETRISEEYEGKI